MRALTKIGLVAAISGLVTLGIVNAAPASASAFSCAGVVSEGQVYVSWTGTGGTYFNINNASFFFLQGDFDESQSAYPVNPFDTSVTSYYSSGATLQAWLSMTNSNAPGGSTPQAGFANFTYCPR